MFDDFFCVSEGEVMAKRVCENCRWWDRYPLHPYGDCRRNPPIDIDGSVPQTAPTDWCGEWSDASITPEQAERRELTRQFAVAISAKIGCYTPAAIWEMAKNMAAAEPQIQKENEQ